jgi:alanyl-tRNA synthetase
MGSMAAAYSGESMPKYLSTNQIRELYLSFFESKGHLRYPSHPIPVYDDPTLMFSVAGMTQFKPQFVGAAAKFPGIEGEWKRVTTSQKCIRIGDIENVGRTNRHCSFFEMLGNFSFDSYFKREAIEWAWEFLTGPQWLGLEAERIHVTIYKDDDEAFAVWTESVGLDPAKIHRFDADENFWPQNAPSLGPNGPCGPCSEIYYDRGPDFGSDTWADYYDTRESTRFLEIWNLVFPGYNRSDGPDGTGALEDLGRRNIDTGMGMVRVAALAQNVEDFYQTDDFLPLIHKIAELSGQAYQGPKSVSQRVIAEHIRMVSLTVADGVTFSFTGRGYVLRKVLRRASRHAYLLGFREPMLYQLVPLVVATLGTAYPELIAAEATVALAIKNEESRFLRTLESGIDELNLFLALALMSAPAASSGITWQTERPDAVSVEETLHFSAATVAWLSSLVQHDEQRLQHLLDRVTKRAPRSSAYDDKNVRVARRFKAEAFEAAVTPVNKPQGLVFPGESAFTLYATFGFPLDLTQEIIEEQGMTLERAGFDEKYKAQQLEARNNSKFDKNSLFVAVAEVLDQLYNEHGETVFVGYSQRQSESTVLALLSGNELISKLSGGEALVVLNRTPFYAEGGGQVGDSGLLRWDGGLAKVLGTQKTPNGLFLQQIHLLEGTLEAGLLVEATVDSQRLATERHHTATHLLQAALRAVLGAGVAQKGSLVTPNRLRFDFSHPTGLSRDEVKATEQLVNRWIAADYAVTFASMPLDEARKSGAMALFGEKYGETVRVVSVEGAVSSLGIIEPATRITSKELCGGTHVGQTGQIGQFVIVSEEGTAAGVRRIEALCGEAAGTWTRSRLELLEASAAQLNATAELLPERLGRLQEELKGRERQINELKHKLVQAQTKGSGESALVLVGGFKLARLLLAEVSGNELRLVADDLLAQSQADIVVVASDGHLVVKASKSAVAAGAHAGQLIARLAVAGGGKGGGRPDMAMAGITNPQAALAAIDN